MATSLLKSVLALSDQPSTNWIERAKATSALKKHDESDFRKLLDMRPTQARTVHYLVQVWDTFSKLGFSEDELAKVGWTKLQVIIQFCEEGTEQMWASAACDWTVPELKQALKEGKPATQKNHSLNFSLSPSQYKILRASLIKHGAAPSKNGRGLDDKERALIKAIKGSKD